MVLSKKSSSKTAIATYAYRLMLADADEISETFRDEVWRLWAVLESMEHDAHTVLKRQPVDTIAERPPITEIFSIRRHLANDLQGAAVIDFTEEEHLIAYCELPNLNEEQRNAIEALRSMWRIRVHIAAADQLDNGYPITTARSLCERVALEMMMLAFSFRGEFKTRLKPFLDRPALNKAKAESDQETIKRLAIQYRQKSIKGTISQIQRNWQGKPPPAYGKCFPIVQELFKKKSHA